MNKPKIATYALGNGLVAFGLMAMFAVCTYLWWVGRLGGELAFVSLLFAAWAQRANEELTRYRQWQAQWNNYGPSGDGTSTAARRGPSPRTLTSIGVLTVWVCLLSTVKPGQPNTAFAWFTLALIGYGLATLVMAMVAAWRRRGRRQTATQKRDYDLVAVCAQPAQTPSLHEAYRQLPDYCYRLFQTAARS